MASQRNVLLLTTPVSHVRTGGIAQFAKERGWHLMIADRLSRLPGGWTGDGALATIRGGPAVLDFVRTLRRRRIPVVDLTFDHPEIRVPRVSGDHAACGRLAAEHFLERHFRHAAWFSTVWNHSHALRFSGFHAAWTANGHEDPARWVLAETRLPNAFDNWARAGRHLGKLLRDAPKPLAVIGYDDADAARVEAAALAAGLSVPEEIAIIGIGDDRLVCEYQPVPLSSVNHDLARIGYEGATLLERIMDGEPPPRQPILVPPAGIVTRASTDSFAVEGPALRRALVWMRDHLDRSFGAAQLAEAIGVPRRTLDRLFADGLGTSVGHEALRQRLAQAKLLLRANSIPISEIAARTGFSSPAHLSHAFKSAFGLSPRAWRAAAR